MLTGDLICLTLAVAGLCGLCFGLGLRLGRAGQAPPSRPRAAASAAAVGDESIVAGISEFELIKLAGESAASGTLRQQRWPYRTWQVVAPLEGALPELREFKRIQCLDLSIGGVSFYSHEVPTCERVVISIGPASNWLFLEARVVHYRSTLVDGKPSFLVGCRFVRRLGTFAEVWRDATVQLLPQETRPSPYAGAPRDCAAAGEVVSA